MKNPVLEVLLMASLGLGFALHEDPPSPGDRLEGIASDPLHLPSQVLALDRGRAVVLDGANSRLAFFTEDGAVERYVGAMGRGSREFMQPYGMGRGPGGEVIVADTGNGRLQVLSKEGAFLRTVDLTEKIHGAEPTGIACDVPGNRIFVTDRRDHEVHVLSFPCFDLLATYPIHTMPRDLPAFPCHPVWSGELLYLVEPLNSRIRSLDPEGGQIGFIGGSGFGPGRLYKPKGIGLDDKGRIFVSDGWRKVVSIFEPSGRFLGYLAGASEEPRRFETPCGLAFDRWGRLMVVEMDRHSVVKARIKLAAGKEQVNRYKPGARKGAEEDPKEEPACTICHPEWMEHGEEELEGIGLFMEGGSPAGQRETCLSCHDGSVAESRHSAFALHSHGSGGELTCMTCHQAHGKGEDNYSMESAIFLRIPGPKGGICLACHSRFGEAEGSHFMGAMGAPVPEVLVRTGAAPSASAAGEIHCRTCHLPHGRGDRFLLAGGESGPCEACHSGVEHGFEPHARSGLFSCRACHPSHGAKKGRLLAESPGSEDRHCTGCHEKETWIADSAHGLADENGGCLFCHAPFAREGSAPFLWGLGQGRGESLSEQRCRICHDRSGMFPEKPVAESSHPGGAVPGEAGWKAITCVTCHDPHAPDPAFLLSHVAESLCASCHGPEALWLFLNFHQEKRGL